MSGTISEQHDAGAHKHEAGADAVETPGESDEQDDEEVEGAVRRENEVRAWRRAHSDEKGDYRPDLRLKALNDYKNMQARLPLISSVNVYGEQGGSTFGIGTGFEWWKQIGAPYRTDFNGSTVTFGGIIWDIFIDPSTATAAADGTMFLATDGGIWKSVDGGNSFVPKTDRLGDQWFGAVVADPAGLQDRVCRVG